MQVDEQGDVAARAATASARQPRTRRPSCGRRPSCVAASRIDARVRHRRLARAHQRLDAEQRAASRVDDRLERHPHPRERLLEAHLEAGAIGGAGVPRRRSRARRAGAARARARAPRGATSLTNAVDVERLGQVAERAVLDARSAAVATSGAPLIRITGHVEIDAAHRAQQIEAAAVRHLDVADDRRRTRRVAERGESRAAACRPRRRRSRARRSTRASARRSSAIVVGDEHARRAGRPRVDRGACSASRSRDGAARSRARSSGGLNGFASSSGGAPPSASARPRGSPTSARPSILGAQLAQLADERRRRGRRRARRRGATTSIAPSWVTQIAARLVGGRRLEHAGSPRRCRIARGDRAHLAPDRRRRAP